MRALLHGAWLSAVPFWSSSPRRAESAFTAQRNAHHAAPHARPALSSGDDMSNVVTIEKTGKTWKGMRLISVLMFITGVLALTQGSSGAGIGVTVIFFGLVLNIVSRAGAWWFHG